MLNLFLVCLALAALAILPKALADALAHATKSRREKRLAAEIEAIRKKYRRKEL